jgi:hypothetical protein
MKTILAAFAAGLVATSAGAVPLTFNFNVPSGNLGNSHTYTVAGLPIVASGFNESFAPTALFGKNAGGGEQGLGLVNDPTGENEIHFGKGFVQLDVTALFGKVKPSSVFFSTNSTTNGEQWGVYGSNTSGFYSGGPLATGSTQSTHLLPSFGSYKYYDFVEINHTPGQGDNILLHAVTAVTVPEPASWAMLVIGFGLTGALHRRRRAVAVAA